MTNKVQDLMQDHDEQEEQYEESEDIEYAEDQGHYEEGGEEYQEEEEEEEEEEGTLNENFRVGQEIALTHQEVWDDSALIEAWDTAVKQYEVYHSKVKSEVKTMESSPLPKTKSRALPPTVSPKLSNKRVKLNGSNKGIADKVSKLDKIQSENSAAEDGFNQTEISINSNPEQEVPALSLAVTESSEKISSSGYAATDRKPSFKKTDKNGFNHYKESRVHHTKNHTAAPTKNSKPIPESSKTKQGVHTGYPPVDAATIAYYQQLGYYYDPSYDASATFSTEETGEGEENQTRDDEGVDDGISRSRDKNKSRINRTTTTSSSNAASASNSNPFAKNSSASAHSNAAGTFSTIAGSGQPPIFPPTSASPYPHMSPFQHGYHPGYMPYTPTSMSGDGRFSRPGVMQGTSPVWGRFGPGVGPPPMPTMPSMPIPMPMPMPMPMSDGMRHHPVSMVPPPPHLAGQFSDSGMDDDALSNLIMAWYFSGYYTGLYQAQRR